MINGGHFDPMALLGIKLGDTPDHAGLDLLEFPHRLAAGRKETLLVFPTEKKRSCTNYFHGFKNLPWIRGAR